MRPRIRLVSNDLSPTICRLNFWFTDLRGLSGRVTRDPNRKCSGAKVGIREDSLSGALSIGRFVVSRWQVCGGRGKNGYGFSIVTETKQETCPPCVHRENRNVALSIGAILTTVARPNKRQFRST